MSEYERKDWKCIECESDLQCFIRCLSAETHLSLESLQFDSSLKNTFTIIMIHLKIQFNTEFDLNQDTLMCFTVSLTSECGHTTEMRLKWRKEALEQN